VDRIGPVTAEKINPKVFPHNGKVLAHPGSGFGISWVSLVRDNVL
jgi:hypothetical protein